MGVRHTTPSSARKRYYKKRLKRTGVLVALALILALVVCGSLADPVLAPDSDTDLGLLSPHTPLPLASATPEVEPTAVVTAEVTPEQKPRLTVALPTQGQLIPPSEDTQILYYTIAGDSLPMVSVRFGVDAGEITSPDPINHQGLISPGQLLIIPNRLGETSSSSKLLPDSEVTFSPSTVEFDTQAYLEGAGGYLAEYTQYLASTGWTTGADIIDRIAMEYSINPRLLLAFLEFQSGWVYGSLAPETDTSYPMGYVNDNSKGLYKQSAWFASAVMDGYYGWREGRMLAIDFMDGQSLRLAPQLNAGTVGLMHAFTKLYEIEAWGQALYGDQSLFVLFDSMFGDPWIRAQDVEPLIPADTVQPEMILPFELNRRWTLTGGPHAAWSATDVWAAIDFAPGTSAPGCEESNAWVVAAMPGLVVRSGNGVVVIDMDGDGYEQTGWTLLYLHIATKDRVEEGEWVEVGDRIGHPSCEGGRSTGTHVHIARRYNGEWVPADGPLPFTLSGWEAKAGNDPYKGWLIRGNEIVYANISGGQQSQIVRAE